MVEIISKHDFDAVVARLNTANQEIRRLEGEVSKLQQGNAILVDEKKQWVQQKEMQDMIIGTTLGHANAKNNNMLQIINELKERLRKLEGK